MNHHEAAKKKFVGKHVLVQPDILSSLEHIDGIWPFTDPIWRWQVFDVVDFRDGGEPEDQVAMVVAYMPNCGVARIFDFETAVIRLEAP